MLIRFLAALFGALLLGVGVPVTALLMRSYPEGLSGWVWLTVGGVVLGALLGALFPKVFGFVFEVLIRSGE